MGKTKSLIFIFFIVLCYTSTYSQVGYNTKSVTGNWRGFIMILDNEQDKYISINIEMKLRQEGDNIIGTSFDYITSPRTYCIANIDGSILHNKITLSTKSIQIQKQHPNYHHAMVVYQLEFVHSNTLEGSVIVADNEAFNFDTDKHPLRIFLTQYGNTYDETHKYNYVLPESSILLKYIAIDKKINSLFDKRNEVKEGTTKNETTVVKQKTKTENEKNNSQIKSDDEDVFATVTYPNANELNKKNSYLKQENLLPHNDLKLNELSQSKQLSKALQLITPLNNTRINILHNLLKQNKSVENLSDYCLEKAVKGNNYTFDFVDTFALFTIEGETNNVDTVAVFLDKKIVVPFLEISSGKKHVFQLDFEEDDVHVLMISNVNLSKMPIRMRINLKDKSSHSHYNLKITNTERENSKLVLIYNDVEANLQKKIK